MARRKIGCLTPTGDRRHALDRSRFYIARSIVYEPVDWIVVDDGEVPYKPADSGCIYLRRTPDGPRSLGRQFIYGVKFMAEMGYTDIIIWEDDDWYHPLRIHRQTLALAYFELHGWKRSFYYNVNQRVYRQMSNEAHASFFETAMKTSVALKFIENLKEDVFLDLLLWKMPVEKRLNEFDGTCIGIKGMPGRAGLGSGHRPIHGYTPDPDMQVLSSMIELDVPYYRPFFQGGSL